MKSNIKSIITLFIAAIVWGFAFSAQAMVDTNILGNFSFNGVRFILGSVSLVPVALIFERKDYAWEKLKKTAIAAAVAGTVLFIASALQQYGISVNHNAGKAGFITGLYTVLVPIVGLVVLKNKTGINTWIAAALAVCGLFLLSVGDGFDAINMGDVVVFIGAFFWAGHILVIDRFVSEVSPIKFALLQFFICGIWNLLFAAFLENITISGICMTAVPILYTGLMSTGVAYTCQILGQKGMNPNLSAIILSTECVFSAVGGAIVLGESMSAKGYLGCVLMFMGILVSQFDLKTIAGWFKGKKDSVENL